jgi:benzoate-CoA ligase
MVRGAELERRDETADGEIGDLLVKGESVAAAYWRRHERTKQAFNGEWFHSGDKYYRDADGYYWYCGRSDDMLKVGGQWVSPAEVEATLIQHPGVLESGVVGWAGADELVKPYAFVVLKRGSAASDALAREIQAFVRDKIAPFKYPRWIEFVPELPKTATGKIQRFRLRERLARGSAPDGAHSSAPAPSAQGPGSRAEDWRGSDGRND